MSEAPDEIAAGSRPGGGRRSAGALIGILVLLVLAAAASYIYNQSRQDIEQRQAAAAATGGDPTKGPDLLKRYGCAGCHTIPGVDGASGEVGPDLGGIARRVYVAGVLTNTPEHLVEFIVDPQAIDPRSAMPRTGITPQQARDVAAYLYSIRK